MCCATKATLVNVILWLLTLIGIAPLTINWVDTFEHWIGYEQSFPPAIHAYKTVDELDLQALVFEPAHPEGSLTIPAVVSFYDVHMSEAVVASILTLCEDLAQLGYVAIAFEYRLRADDLPSHAHPSDIDDAVTWLLSRAAGYKINQTQITVLAFSGQILPVVHAKRGLIDASGTANLSNVERLPAMMVLPSGTDLNINAMLPFLPSLIAEPTTN